MKSKLIIKNNDYAEPLNSVIVSSFQITKTVNQSWQIQFNAYDDESVAFGLLQAQNSVLFEGQEFVIKQVQPTYANDFTISQVTATHIGYQVERIFQHNQNQGTKTYSVNDVLSFYLNGNQFGYTWEVIGNFDNEEIDNLGNSSGKDMLSKITSTWNNAVIDFDNTHIKVYNAENYYHDDGNVITYLGNSNQVQVSYDSTNLVNKLYCVSENGDNNQPAFQPFYVQNDDSINKYGVFEGNPITDNRFNNPDAMRQYAQTQLQPEPSISIQVQFNGKQDIAIGEIRTLIIPDIDFKTKVNVTQVTIYPLCDTQNNQAQLDNTAQTILDYNNALHGLLSGHVDLSQTANNNINNAIANNQQAIDKINQSLQQTTQTVSNDSGSVTFTFSQNVVYVNCSFSDIAPGTTSFAVPSSCVPKSTINGSLVLNVNGENYIVNYTLDSNFAITSIFNLQNQQVTEISNPCTGNFNYLI